MIAVEQLMMVMAEEAEERISRYRTLTGAVLGLALGFSAFSLVEFPIHSLFDLMIALVVFANLFTIILGIWQDVKISIRHFVRILNLSAHIFRRAHALYVQG